MVPTTAPLRNLGPDFTIGVGDEQPTWTRRCQASSPGPTQGDGSELRRGQPLGRRAADRDRVQHEVVIREDIGRGLLDTVIHRVQAAGILIEGGLGSTTDPALTQRLEEVVTLLDDTVRELRGVVLGLGVDVVLDP